MSWLLKDKVATWNHSSGSAHADLRSSPCITLSCQSSESELKVCIVPQDSTSQTKPGDFVPLGDCYVRQGDLVAHFPERKPFHFGYQAYFCAVSSDSQSQMIEIWLSVQTSKLESHPQLVLELHSPTAGLTQHPEIQGLYRCERNNFGVLIHPLDQSDTILTQGNRERPSLVTFGRFMEKGVIRRMRMRLVASPVAVTDRQWREWMDTFAESPLPLTA